MAGVVCCADRSSAVVRQGGDYWAQAGRSAADAESIGAGCRARARGLPLARLSVRSLCRSSRLRNHQDYLKTSSLFAEQVKRLARRMAQRRWLRDWSSRVAQPVDKKGGVAGRRDRLAAPTAEASLAMLKAISTTSSTCSSSGWFVSSMISALQLQGMVTRYEPEPLARTRVLNKISPRLSV